MTEKRNYLVGIKHNDNIDLITFMFELFRPRPDVTYYGNGCYMCVTTPDGFEDYVDVRYTGKNYLEDFVELWLKSKYGERLKGWKEL